MLTPPPPLQKNKCAKFYMNHLPKPPRNKWNYRVPKGPKKFPPIFLKGGTLWVSFHKCHENNSKLISIAMNKFGGEVRIEIYQHMKQKFLNRSHRVTIKIKHSLCYRCRRKVLLVLFIFKTDVFLNIFLDNLLEWSIILLSKDSLFLLGQLGVKLSVVRSA